MDFWANFWDIIGWFLWAFVFIAYLMAVFAIISDLFRDEEESGWAKAIWIIFLIFIPFLTALIYLIVRGRGMARRSAQAAMAQKQATDSYIQSVASHDSPSNEIARAKQLLADGTIDQAEYERLKEKALA